MNIGVLKGALVHALPLSQKTDMQHSAQTHTPDNAPRASMQCVNGLEVRDKKKKKGKK